MSMIKQSKKWLKLSLLLSATALLGYGGYALAADASVATVASNVYGTFWALARLITAMAYIAGMGFAMAAILKFKAHKENPTQIPVGTPIALIFVAAALIFLPTIFGVAGQTVFGDTKTQGTTTGVQSFGTT